MPIMKYIETIWKIKEREIAVPIWSAMQKERDTRDNSVRTVGVGNSMLGKLSHTGYFAHATKQKIFIETKTNDCCKISIHPHHESC